MTDPKLTGPKHPFDPLPLLPSGPGGVHKSHVARDQNHLVPCKNKRKSLEKAKTGVGRAHEA